MSRHHPPPAHSPSITRSPISPSNMTETQNCPNLPLTTFHHDPFRPTLPPLSTVTHSSLRPPPPRPDFQSYAPQPRLPTIQPPSYQPRPQPPSYQSRPQPSLPTHQRYSHEPAVRETTTASHAYPGKPESRYSPHIQSATSSPRNEFPGRLPQRFTRDGRPYYEDHRHHSVDVPFVSPVERRPPSFPSAFPSPRNTYDTSPHAFINTAVRASVSSHSSSAPSSAIHREPSSFTQRSGPSAQQNSPAAPRDEREPYKYDLKVRQQPIAARACGFGERDRRVIDPPPIIQLQVTDTETNELVHDELRYGLHVLHCALYDARGEVEMTSLVQEQKRPTRRLMGQLVASPSVAKDEHDAEGCFFCFPDLSCRTHGQYTLRFVLIRVDPSQLQPGNFFPVLTVVLSDVFTVYTAKDFPGMRPSSALTRALKLQGCNIQVKKGNDKALARKRIPHSSDDDLDEMKRRRMD